MEIFVIDIQQLIILVRNDIFQRNLEIALGIYWGLSIRNFIQICSDLTFLLHDVYGVSFFTEHSVVLFYMQHWYAK